MRALISRALWLSIKNLISHKNVAFFYFFEKSMENFGKSSRKILILYLEFRLNGILIGEISLCVDLARFCSLAPVSLKKKIKMQHIFMKCIKIRIRIEKVCNSRVNFFKLFPANYRNISLKSTEMS